MKKTGLHRKGELSLEQIMKSLRDSESFKKVGAVGFFVGIVRGEGPDRQDVTKIEVEAYEEKAEQKLSQIRSDLIRKRGIVDVRVYHNVGEFNPGDELVYVAVAGGHRREVFSVLRDAVERYKHEAPLFKKEHLTDRKTGKASTRWVEEKAL